HRMAQRFAEHRAFVLGAGVIRRLDDRRAVIGQLDLEPLRSVRQPNLHADQTSRIGKRSIATLRANARRNAAGGLGRAWRWRPARAAAWALLERHVAPE